MGELATLEGETSAEVVLQYGCLSHGVKDGLVEGLLVLSAGLVDLLLLCFGSEELLLGLLLLSSDRALEVVIVELLIDLNATEVDLGGSGDGESLVDTAKRNTVDLVGSGDEQ